MNYSIGIDLSLTGAGIIVLNFDGKIEEQELLSTTPKEEIENRIMFIGEKVISIVNKYPNSEISIEGLSHGSASDSMLELAALHYYVRILLKNQNLSFEVLPPTSLKKFLTGKGHAKKELMLLYVYKKYGEEFHDNNLADAYALARYGMRSK